MNRDTKSHLIWGILGQIIIVVLAAVALDGALSCYALLASSISYWVLFAVMTRRVRSRLDTLFLRFGIIILFCALDYSSGNFMISRISNQASPVDDGIPILFHTDRPQSATTHSRRWAA